MAPRRHAVRTAILVLFVTSVPSLASSVHAQAPVRAPFSIADILSPAFPYELVAARRADRIAWLEFERGMRNVYTAAAPDFSPVRLTSYGSDDGVDLTGLRISDDGSLVTFIRGHARNREGWVANPASDPRGGERVVHAVGTSGGTPWRVVEADGQRLSPDGKWVLYERSGEVYRATVNPGLAPPADPASDRPLFRVFGRNGGAVWSPDGRRVAFVSQRTDHAYVGVYDADVPAVTYLAPGVDRDGAPSWSPDGTQVAFLRRPGLPYGAVIPRARNVPDSVLPAGLVDARFRGGHTLEIWVADAATGEGRRLWHPAPEDTAFSVIRSIAWVGDHIVFEAEPGDWQRWFSIPVRTPPARPVELTPGEGFVEHVSFSADGRFLYYASNAGDLDRRDLWRVPVAGGEAVRLTRGAGIETYPAVLASGDVVAVLYADARRPQSVALVPATGGEARVITPLPAAFPLRAQVEPSNVTLTASDGVTFNNQLFLPPGLRPGERRPALVFVHGGPRRQMLLGYHYMHFYHMAYAMHQYFAAQGYVVLSVNYRSGIGYGKAFRNAPDVNRRGMAEYRDVLAAGRYLEGRPDVDPSRIGIWGLSYGGILTAQALARNSDLFAAGVDMAGVHLWGDALDPESLAYRSSAVSEIGRWTSPVLLMHGDDDRNVAFSQTVGLVQVLRGNDVPFELIVFPDDVHDSLLFHRWLTAFGATDDFLRRTLIRRERIGS